MIELKLHINCVFEFWVFLFIIFPNYGYLTLSIRLVGYDFQDEYPDYIVDEFLELIGNIFKGQEGVHIDEAVQHFDSRIYTPEKVWGNCPSCASAFLDVARLVVTLQSSASWNHMASLARYSDIRATLPIALPYTFPRYVDRRLGDSHAILPQQGPGPWRFAGATLRGRKSNVG